MKQEMCIYVGNMGFINFRKKTRGNFTINKFGGFAGGWRQQKEKK